jgi:hypothetical protein
VGNEQNFMAYALDYAAAGLYDEAAEFVSACLLKQRVQILWLLLYGLALASAGNQDAGFNVAAKSGRICRSLPVFP